MISAIGFAAAVTTVFVICGACLWRQTTRIQHEFFHFDRVRHVERARRTAVSGLLLAVFAVGALAWWNRALEQDQARLSAQVAALRGEIAELRTAHEVALALRERAQLAAAPLPNAEVASAEIPPPRDALVVVDRAVVRTGPGGTARFTLAAGAQVRRAGRVVYAAGRGWAPIVAADGRSGWIATHLVQQRT